MSLDSRTPISAAAAAVTSAVIPGSDWADKSVSVLLTGTGAVTASFAIDATNDPLQGTNSWVQIDTLNLSGTAATSAAVAMQNRFLYYRFRLVSISGTSAAATLWFIQ